MSVTAKGYAYLWFLGVATIAAFVFGPAWMHLVIPFAATALSFAGVAVTLRARSRVAEPVTRVDYAFIARWEKAEYGAIRSTRADGSPIPDPDADAALRDWPLSIPPRRAETAVARGRFASGALLPAPGGTCLRGHGCASYWTEERGPVCPSCEDKRRQEWRLRSRMTTINEERERLTDAIVATHGACDCDRCR